LSEFRNFEDRRLFHKGGQAQQNRTLLSVGWVLGVKPGAQRLVGFPTKPPKTRIPLHTGSQFRPSSISRINVLNMRKQSDCCYTIRCHRETHHCHRLGYVPDLSVLSV